MVYLFAFISIFLLLPFIWFLKLGISKKGKLLIIISSFIISLLALLTQSSYPIWQTILICLILIATITYLLNKRFENILFEPSDRFPRIQMDNRLIQLEIDDFGHEYDDMNDEEYFYKDELDRVIEEVEEVQQKEINLLNEQNLDESTEELKNNELIEQNEIGDLILEELNLEDISLEKLDLENRELVEIDQEQKKEESPFVEFLNEIKELSPDLFSEIVVEDEDIIELDDNEIIPVKEFKPSTPKEMDSELNKKQPVNRKNYLSEIEKLMEES